MSKHLKRFSAPKHWGLRPKEAVFASKPRPGPHPLEMGVPLLGIVRDFLGYAQTGREAKYIIHQGDVLVDHVVRKDAKFAAGLMDVVSLKRTNENFRLLPDRKGLRLQPISDTEAGFKLVRVGRKTMVKGGKVQLGFHDGSNIELDGKEAAKYSVGDVLQISIPDRKVKDHMKMEPGNVAFVYRGKNSGQLGKIEEVIAGSGTRPASVRLSVGDTTFQTLAEFIFVIGRKRSKIKVD